MPHVNVSKQTINTIIIVAGAALLIYDFVAEPKEVFYKIAGLAVLMFGLYKSTQQWTSDNKTNQDDLGTPLDDDFDPNIDFDDDENPGKNGF